jgi:hypothetical protein
MTRALVTSVARSDCAPRAALSDTVVRTSPLQSDTVPCLATKAPGDENAWQGQSHVSERMSQHGPWDTTKDENGLRKLSS